MDRISPRRWLLILLLVLGLVPGLTAAVGAREPALVLTAFGTSTAAADTYRHLEDQVRARFPGHEIRWAYTSGQVRRKVAREQGRELRDLPQTMQALKAAGFNRVVVQSLHVVPGAEWQEVVQQCRQVPGLQVALGQPLLSSEAEAARVLAALGRDFPPDLKATAVVLVGHGSPDSQGMQAYLALGRLLRSRYPGQNVYLGLVSGQPGRDETLAAVKRGGASTVKLVPLLLVAGEHVNTDILGDGPESWQSRLRALGISRVAGRRQGLGYNDDIVKIYLDHLQEALNSLQN